MTDEVQELQEKIKELLQGNATKKGLTDPLGAGRKSNAKINAWIHINNPNERAQLPRVAIVENTTNFGPVGMGNPNGKQEAFIRIKVKTKEGAFFDTVEVYGHTTGTSFLNKVESKINSILNDTANYGEWSGIGWTIPLFVSSNFFESSPKQGVEKIIDYRFEKFCT